MKDPRDIILEPIISEKTYRLLDENKYTFIVDKRANKNEIKIAVENLFDVRVLGVNTQNRMGKVKRRGLSIGKRKDIKKAVVSLQPGDDIDLFTI